MAKYQGTTLLRQTAVTRLLLFAAFMLLGMIVGSQTQQSKAQGISTIYLPLVTKPEPYEPFPRGTNLLQNNSYEGEGDCQIQPPNNPCWYHPNNIPELQIPRRWIFTWEEGPTGYGNQSWDIWTRPEVRVLPSYQLPIHEQPLFIWDGSYTVKIFKGNRPVNFTLTQNNVWLTPGTYIFEMSVFPDLVDHYENGVKIWAPDPLSGEVRLLAGNSSTDWLLPTFGTKNTYYLVFNVTQAQHVTMGAALRGRYALNNNGWFMDDWHLWQATGPTPPPGVYTDQLAVPRFAAEYVPPLKPAPLPVEPAE